MVRTDLVGDGAQHGQSLALELPLQPTNLPGSHATQDGVRRCAVQFVLCSPDLELGQQEEPKPKFGRPSRVGARRQDSHIGVGDRHPLRPDEVEQLAPGRDLGKLLAAQCHAGTSRSEKTITRPVDVHRNDEAR